MTEQYCLYIKLEPYIKQWLIYECGGTIPVLFPRNSVERGILELFLEELPENTLPDLPKDEDDLTPRTRENISLEELQSSWMAKMHDNCVFISAKKQINIDTLKELLYAKAKEIHLTRFPYNDFLFQKYDEEDLV